MIKASELAHAPEVKDLDFQKMYDHDSANLDAGIAVQTLRLALNLNQAEFAKVIGQPEEFVSQLESGLINVPEGLLDDIATKTHKRLEIHFR